MSSHRFKLRRLGAIVLAAFCSLFLLACGNNDDEEGAEISTVIANAILDEDAVALCNELVSERFISDIYGDVEKCVAAEQSSNGEDPDEVRVADIEVDGETATASLTEVGGDTDGATGTVTLVRVGDSWRIDELGIDYLRSQLERGFANEDQFNEEEHGPLADPAIRDCANEQLQALDDDAFRAMAYASKADREPSDDFIEALSICIGPQPAA